MLGYAFSATFLLSGCFKEDINFAEGQANTETSLLVVRNLFKGSALTLNNENLDGAMHIKAIVVSDPSGNNLPANIIAIQNTWRNQTRGLLMEVADVSQYKFGDSLQVNLTNLQLLKEKGSLILKGANAATLNTLSTGNTLVSRPATIQALISKFEDFESTYIDITADLQVEPSNGTPLKGSKILVDAANTTINLFTQEEATFANQSVAPSATFRGVLFKDDSDVQLRLQSYAGMAFPSGRIYGGWPETFEGNVVKGGYAPAVVTFATGLWNLDQSLIGVTPGRDRIVSGKQAIRFQQNLTVPAFLQMNFDVPLGASKVTLWYGSYFTDRSCSFQLEYSQDQGQTWIKTGDVITDAHSTAVSLEAKQAIFLMNIQGPVRFRVNKLGLGSTSNVISNGRFGMDDVAIYRSF